MAQRYWLGTLFAADEETPLWTCPDALPAGCCWLKGQREECPTTGRIHVQLIAGFSQPQRLAAVKRIVAPGHWEPSRSHLADNYVWKEDTRVPGTQFEIGSKPLRRNNATDWGQILSEAKTGNFSNIPADIQIRYYRSLSAIASDNQEPRSIVKTVNVYHGRFYFINFRTGTGKSRRAWEEAGLQAYSKDPRTKWWDGYKGESNVVIDEFRGTIDISHILRWFDRYPVRVERKGSSVPLYATTFWITSNLVPDQWYPDLDQPTKEALLRRLTNIIEFE